MTDRPPVVLIALASLAAEGTPRMALALCREWLAQGMRPIVMVLEAAPDDLVPDFEAIKVECIVLGLPHSGYLRYASLVYHTFIIARRYSAKSLLSMPLGWHAFMAIGARLAGVRRVVAHVGNYPNLASPGFAKFKALVQLGRPITHRLACCSYYVQRGALKNFGIREQETAVIYNGAAVTEFVPRTSRRAELEIGAERFTVGMVARLEKHKDHVTLIHAAKILKARGRALSFVLIGEGSQRQRLQQLIESEGLSATVVLLGTQRDIAGALNEMDVFAFSTTPDEGLGIALTEAMLCGIPVVATDVGACREVLDNGRLGLLVPERDPEALANAIDAIRTSSFDAQRRAVLAREHAARMFSSPVMARAYAELLELPCAESPAPMALLQAGRAA